MANEIFKAGYVKRTLIEPVAVHIPVAPVPKEKIEKVPEAKKPPMVEKPPEVAEKVAEVPRFIETLDRYQPILPWLMAGVSVLSLIIACLLYTSPSPRDS